MKFPMYKRAMDILLSTMALVFFLPIMVVISLMIIFTMGNPVFYCQSRPGLKNKVFNVYKFRTMSDSFDNEGKPLPDENRVTKLGLMLRRTSLDELPQLINILKGDMSIVGPRPLLMEYSPYLTRWERRRHEVKPGLTGLAQVHGRQDISWEDKFKLDVEYVDNYSIALDAKIIFLTIRMVMKREGILYAAPQGRLDDYRRALDYDNR
ncbi:sugar transferase [Onishia taeanensis]